MLGFSTTEMDSEAKSEGAACGSDAGLPSEPEARPADGKHSDKNLKAGPDGTWSSKRRRKPGSETGVGRKIRKLTQLGSRSDSVRLRGLGDQPGEDFGVRWQ